MNRPELNQFAEAISSLIPNKNHFLEGVPTSQDELNSMFKIEMEDGTHSSNPSDFGFTFAQANSAFATQKTNDKLLDLRQVRDAKLAESDWTQGADSPLTDSKKTEWATYRQSLRDITDSATSLDDVSWPEKP